MGVSASCLNIIIINYINLVLFLCRYWNAAWSLWCCNTSLRFPPLSNRLIVPSLQLLIQFGLAESTALLPGCHGVWLLSIMSRAPSQPDVRPSLRPIPWSPWRLPWQPQEAGKDGGARRSWWCRVTSCHSLRKPGLPCEAPEHWLKLCLETFSLRFCIWTQLTWAGQRELAWLLQHLVCVYFNFLLY